MRIETVNKTVKMGLKYLTPILASGLIALGSASTASADDFRRYSDGPRHNRAYGYDNDRYDHRSHRRHYKRNKGHKTVIVYHNYPRYRVKKVKEVHHYYHQPEPVHVERRRVVEHRRYVEPPATNNRAGYYGPSGTSLIGAAIGGLLGSQVGKGDGQLAATAAGAITGYWVGGQH